MGINQLPVPATVCVKKFLGSNMFAKYDGFADFNQMELRNFWLATISELLGNTAT